MKTYSVTLVLKLKGSNEPLFKYKDLCVLTTSINDGDFLKNTKGFVYKMMKDAAKKDNELHGIIMGKKNDDFEMIIIEFFEMP